MSSTIAPTLERALLRSGDDLYRLALLLAPDTASAEKALLAAIRNLASTGTAPDDQALLAALMAAQPRERRRWRPVRLPVWARPSAAHASQAPLLQAIARLPRRMRLALGLTMLRGLEADQAALLLGLDEAAMRAQVRDALLALAPIVSPELTPDALDPALAPEDCRPTRVALALSDPRLHTDTTVRGHLALCAACRAIEQAWLKLTITFEETLRGALREARVSEPLSEQLQAATQPELTPNRRALLGTPQARLALVALPVLALIAFMVWPRGTTPTATSGRDATLPPAPALHDQVKRASAQLYIPPTDGVGTWHSRYEIQWFFPNNSSALLEADQWIDPASGRHRVQLIHHDGGGPYEFELADGAGTAWYAISPTYVPSIYPLSANPNQNRVELPATPDEQHQMLQARLQSGAWGLATAYLRQAASADLRSWGRQRDANGALLDLIGFSGNSPLALPPDAPGATTSQVTILLAIDEASGRLREVRELLGAAGTEQTARTTWRILADEWIGDQPTRDRLFNLQQAWNGIGTFDKRTKLASPALPLIGADAATPLAVGVDLYWSGIWMPSSPPSGTTVAVLVNHADTPADPNGLDPNGQFTFVYLGDGRRLEISTSAPGIIRAPIGGGEQITLNGQQLTVLPTNGQGYQAQIYHPSPFGNQFSITQVAATGYTLAQLKEVLQTLGPPSLDVYRAQARLFAYPPPSDAAAFDALLGALVPTPSGGARHFVERVFKRHSSQPDPLSDPYHRPPYGGWPEQVIQDNWSRRDSASGGLESTATTRGANGTLYGQQYISATQSGYYDAPADKIHQSAGQFLSPEQQNNEDQNTILHMLACGRYQLQTAADGTRQVAATESLTFNSICQHPQYLELFHCQTAANPNCQGNDQTPYLGDTTDGRITTVIDIGADGRAPRIQTWSGQPKSGGILLESWELLSDEQVPADHVPAAAFEPQPPAALIHETGAFSTPDRPAPVTMPITEALTLARSTLFGLQMTAPLSRTDVITTTGFEPPQIALADVIVGSPPSISNGPQYNDQSPFDRALIEGYAARLTYTISQTSGISILQVYEGPANAFSAYLRSLTPWSSSAAVKLEIDGKQVDGWSVVEPQGNATWLLFQLDGTLIAVAGPPPELLWAIHELRPIR